MRFLAFQKIRSTVDINCLICKVVGFLFVYAGISKAIDMEGFAASIIAYQLTGPYISKFLASMLPYIEILAGGLLLAGFVEKESLIIIAGLSMIFTGVICYAMTADLQISCCCFDSNPQPENLFLSVVRNLGIIGACFYCLTRKDWFYGLT